MSGSGSGNSSVGNRQIYQADDKMASPGDKEVIIDPVEQMQKDPTYPVCFSPSFFLLYLSLPPSLQITYITIFPHGSNQATQKLTREWGDICPQAKSHGNEPSKGAKIDAEIMQDEQEELRKKGKA